MTFGQVITSSKRPGVPYRSPVCPVSPDLRRARAVSVARHRRVPPWAVAGPGSRTRRGPGPPRRGRAALRHGGPAPPAAGAIFPGRGRGHRSVPALPECGPSRPRGAGGGRARGHPAAGPPAPAFALGSASPRRRGRREKGTATPLCPHPGKPVMCHRTAEPRSEARRGAPCAARRPWSAARAPARAAPAPPASPASTSW